MRCNRIGLYGGSFDPVHNAHLALAIAAKSHLQLDQLQIIPAANPWQRAPLKAAAPHRLKMLNLAIEPHKKWLIINDTEIKRGGKTYTIDTINQLPKNNNYFWIMGSDQLDNFCSWHKWQEISNQITLAVAQRPKFNLHPPEQLQQYLTSLNKNIVQIPFNPLDISATEIRQILNNHPTDKQLENLIPTTVLNYIIEHGLYQN